MLVQYKYGNYLGCIRCKCVETRVIPYIQFTLKMREIHSSHSLLTHSFFPSLSFFCLLFLVSLVATASSQGTGSVLLLLF